MAFNLFSQKSLSVVQQSNDALRFLRYANENRIKHFFNDVKIKVGKTNLEANSLILSCFSKYFEKHLRKKPHSSRLVEIDGLVEASVADVIAFMYSCELVIDQDNVLELLVTAIKLEVENLVMLCCQYLISIVNINNCIHLFNFACQNKLISLKSHVHCFLVKHFKMIAQSSSTFKQLSKDEIIVCLEGMNRNEFVESLIYDAMLTWAKHDEQERASDFTILFHKLRVDELSSGFWTNVSSEKLIKDDLSCSNKVMTQLAKRLDRRKTVYNELSIVSIGGDYTLAKVQELFNLYGEVPKAFPDLPIKLHSHSSLKIDETVYCIGGEVDHTETTKQTWQLDLKTDNFRWKRVAELNEKRRNLGAAIFRGELVVAGGFDGKSALKSAEIYIKPFNQWKELSFSLNRPRYGNELVTYNDSLYCIGGYGDGHLSSVELLSDLNESWKFVEKMQTPRMYFAAVCYKNMIYAIGGQSGNDRKALLKNVEKYDPKTNIWSDVGCLSEERYGHSACVLQNKIFVIGGKNKDDKIVRKVEYYDDTKNSWSLYHETDLEWFRHSVVPL